MEAFENHIAELLIALFLIITFLISALEKIADWKNTLVFYNTHFKTTFLRWSVNFWVGIVVILEISVLISIIYGVFSFFAYVDLLALKISFVISSLLLLVLLIGQRIAKDYAGATSITVYFILNILGIYLLN